MSQRKLVSIVLAAGASKRMKSNRSKLLYPLLGRPMIARVFETIHSQSSSVVFVLGHQQDEIKNALSEHAVTMGASFQVAHQAQPKGTADAVLKALPLLASFDSDATDVLILGGDSCTMSRATIDSLIDRHRKSNAVLSFLTCLLSDPAAYGRVIRNSAGAVEKIVEAKDASQSELQVQEINAGFYVISLKHLLAMIKQIQSDNKSNEFYLTDLVSLARKQGLLIQAHAIDSLEALGVNTQKDFALVAEVLRDRINSHWMEQGVTLLDPQSVWIDETAHLEAGVWIEPGTQIRGRTRIEKNVWIGPHSVIEDSLLGEGCRVEASCHLVKAQLKENVTIGPFARLRPGTILEANVHIGNFVEIKNSHLHRGVKSGHLTYLGDSEIGEDSNIGAGTITCNYDGFRKAKTVIGENVFIGSNTSLVAPLEIGDGSIVGAGSVVTRSVAAQSLTLERSDQVDIPQGAEKLRKKRLKEKSTSEK